MEGRADGQGVAGEMGLEFVVPAPQLCTDNGVMVAWAGVERLALGLWEHLPASSQNDDWVDVRPRWPLTDQCVCPNLSSGTLFEVNPSQPCRRLLQWPNLFHIFSGSSCKPHPLHVCRGVAWKLCPSNTACRGILSVGNRIIEEFSTVVYCSVQERLTELVRAT